MSKQPTFCEAKGLRVVFVAEYKPETAQSHVDHSRVGAVAVGEMR